MHFTNITKVNHLCSPVVDPTEVGGLANVYTEESEIFRELRIYFRVPVIEGLLELGTSRSIFEQYVDSCSSRLNQIRGSFDQNVNDVSVIDSAPGEELLKRLKQIRQYIVVYCGARPDSCDLTAAPEVSVLVRKPAERLPANKKALLYCSLKSQISDPRVVRILPVGSIESDQFPNPVQANIAKLALWKYRCSVVNRRHRYKWILFASCPTQITRLRSDHCEGRVESHTEKPGALASRCLRSIRDRVVRKGRKCERRLRNDIALPKSGASGENVAFWPPVEAIWISVIRCKQRASLEHVDIALICNGVRPLHSQLRCSRN